MESRNSQLYAVVYTLCDEAFKHLSGEKRDEIIKIIKEFSIFSAAMALAGNLVPGAGSILTAIGQTGLIWTLYVKINKIIGLEMSNNTAKFVGSAILTNLSLNAGTLLLGYAGAVVASFIPIFGQFTAAAIEASLGYALIYVSAVLYLIFLYKVFQVKGKIDITGGKEDGEIVKDVIKNTKLEELISEAKNKYKEDKNSGDIDYASKNLKCPVCGKTVDTSKEYCTKCGTKLM
jgi:uncharacterized protein (DUF697 family)